MEHNEQKMELTEEMLAEVVGAKGDKKRYREIKCPLCQKPIPIMLTILVEGQEFRCPACGVILRFVPDRRNPLDVWKQQDPGLFDLELR